MQEDRRRSTGSRRRPEHVDGRRRRELRKFGLLILGVLAGIWALWGASYLWFELHSEEEPSPLSLVESAERALARGDAERAGKEAELARLLIDSRLADADGDEKAALLRLAERAGAVEAGLSQTSPKDTSRRK